MKKTAKRKSPDKKNSKRKFQFLPFVFGLIAITGVIVYLVISSNPVKNPQAAVRDPYSWPFDKYSPWNMPLGSKASYKSTPITPAAGYWSEWEVIAMDPNAPQRQGFNRNDGYSFCDGGSAIGNFLVSDGFRTPIANTTPGSGYYLPNNSGGVLKIDKQTIQEGNYITRCTDTGQIYFGRVGGAISITGSGTNIPYGGGHGGSAMSGVGGDLRKWEVTSSGIPIRHALKITLNGRWMSKSNGGHRWPATNTDGGYDVPGGQAEYYGSWPEVNMGSLMTINSSVDINNIGLTTELGKRVAQAMQDYGAYIVDAAYGRDYQYTDPAILNIEYGSVIPSGFGADMMKLWGIFNVVTNNTESTPGGCAILDATCVRRQPYAPDFGLPIVSPTPPTATTIPILPSPSPTSAPIIGSSLEAENMVIRQGYQYPGGNVFSDATASQGKGISLLTNGYLDGQVAGSFSSIAVRARGDQCNGAPSMIVSVDGNSVLTATVPATSWTDYIASYSAGAGNHTVRVDFTNDSNPGTCDRNLRLDIVKTSTISDVDTDNDGFSDKVEAYIGTNPNLVCGVGAWPPDIDGDRAVTILDMTSVANSYQTKVGDPTYSKRYDMDASGTITILDLTIVSNYFLQKCATPQVVPMASRPDVNQFIAAVSKVIEAEIFKLNSGYVDSGKNIFSDPAASGGKGFILWSTGSAQTVTTNGFSKATLRVKADVCSGAPKLTVKIDGKILYSQDFASTAWTDVTVDFAAVAGTNHTVWVGFANDRYRAGVCDRNLRFDKVTLL